MDTTGQNVNKCTYDIPYCGPCGIENCNEHKGIRCQFRNKKTCCIDMPIMCGKLAIGGCSNGATLICGAPLCKEHRDLGHNCGAR